MKGRPPKPRSKPLATYEQNRDMYGFMVRPQHLEQYREYATIYKEEEAERSDRWEQFLISVNENVPPAAPALYPSESTPRSGDSGELEVVLETATNAPTTKENDAEQGAAKLWGQLRKSLCAIERATSIRGRGVHKSLASTSASAQEPVTRRSSAANEASSDSGSPSLSVPVVRNDLSDQSNESKDSETSNDNGQVATDIRREETSGGSGDGLGEESEDEFCDATESTDVLREGDSTSPPKSIPVEAPWEEELRSLVRGGVPMALRGELWQVFVGTKTRRIHGHYNALLTLLADGGGDSDGVGGLLDGSSSAAANYLVSKTGVLEKWTNQIEKDLPRTFPGHPALDEDGRNTLRRLLTAYARHNPSVGYCQAMNFLAALLLLLMPEENSFWTLTGIIDDYFEGYYSEKMVEAQVDQLVFEDLVREQFPKLVCHLDMLGVQVAWVSGPWFLSIFVNVLPWESVLRVWDVLLYEGNRCMLFRTGLALMEIHAPALTATRDAGDAVALLQSIASATFDSSQLVMMACMGFQTVTETRLQSLRHKRRPEVLTALQERSIELHLWRNSNSAITQKLPYLYSLEGSGGDSLLIKKSIVVSEQKLGNVHNLLSDKSQANDGNPNDLEGVRKRGPVSFEETSMQQAISNNIKARVDENGEFDGDLEGADMQERIVWLKTELCRALTEKKAAVLRADELEAALVEMVKEDNRRLLSAKVEKLEIDLKAVNQLLNDKKEQEQALVQVLLRMEQEQKIADDARRFAELDSVAQRRAAEVFQEKYESAADALEKMEKRAVMAESMLEATLSYQALGNQSPHGSGSLRRSMPDPLLVRTPDSKSGSPSLREASPAPHGHENGSNGSSMQDFDDQPIKQGIFNRPFGLNWRDRSKARSGSLDSPTRSPLRTSSARAFESESAIRPLDISTFDPDRTHSVPLLGKVSGSPESKPTLETTN